MSKEIGIISSDEFSNLKIENVVNRECMRDIHYTIRRSIVTNNFEILRLLSYIDVRYYSEMMSEELVSKLFCFSVKDDPWHSYFFQDEWPDQYLSFLRFKDIIPSFVSGIDLSTKNRERALQDLQKANAKIAVHFKPSDMENNQAVRELKDLAIAILESKDGGVVLILPFVKHRVLWIAIQANDERVLKALGKRQRLFTKALRRSDGTKIELYNHLRQKWQICLDEFDVSHENVFSNMDNEYEKKSLIQ
ncbi:hypothetical protein C0583_03385 [Candidatus Parcubacteria bacterium]|nr:MAG: hypothetical protein C0583_03385 [Candidatus Parcubacteria bacterium]